MSGRALVDFAIVAGRRAPRAIASIERPAEPSIAKHLSERLPAASVITVHPDAADLLFAWTALQPGATAIDLVLVSVEDAGDLTPLACAARRLLGKRGRVVSAVAVGLLPSWLGAISRAGLVAKRLRMVHPVREGRAERALIDACRAKPGGLVVEAPWFGDAKTSSR